ncbi:MAG: restriction endonuclease subunit S [Enterococcus casseliflavus]|nr:restriction endonuclease subunit S [Enterococcus casseliflavus]
MNDEITNIPKIRFKGYTEDWEQRKLGRISDKVKEKNKSGKIIETLTNSAEYGIISQRDFFDKDISNVKNLNSYYVVRNDDFIYNPRISNFAPVGPIKRNKLGRTGVMSPLYYVFRTHSISKIYLEKYFDTTYWHRFMELNGDSGARADRFSIKDSVFSDMPIPYPSIEEQQKIGTFFKQLDDTIALHQRELDLLRKTKQTYLQKMFPKTGEDRPEIRFAGFTEPWEQRKLNEGMTEYTDRVYIQENKTYKQVSVKNIGKIVLRGEKKGIQIGRKRQAKVNLTDHPYTLIFTRQTIEQGGIGFAPKETDGAIVTENMPTIDVNNDVINCNYLMAYVKTEDWYRNIILKNIEGGTAQVAIHEDNILSSEVHLPKIEEQQKIGTFFKQLDDTIALHQHDLNTLKEMKKSLLQQMFV